MPERGTHYITSEPSRFDIQIPKAERIRAWESELEGIAPEFVHLGEVGLTSAYAMISEIAEGDLAKIDYLTSIQLFRHEDGIRTGLVNPELIKLSPRSYEMTGKESLSLVEILECSALLIEAARAATKLQGIAGVPRERIGKNMAGWTYRERTYTVDLPYSFQNKAGEFLNTHPAATLGLRYDQYDKGTGFENPDKISFASRLINSAPVSKYVNVWIVNNSDRIGASANAGYVEGEYGEGHEDRRFRDLRDFVRVIYALPSHQT